MKQRLFLLLALILQLFMVTVSATAYDEIQAYRLSVINGLPDNNIRKMYQGKSGTMYFNTQYDSYAFDGYTFRRVDFDKCNADLDIHSSAQGKKVVADIQLDNLGNSFYVTGDGIIHFEDFRTQQNFELRVFDPKLLQLSSSMKVHAVTDIRGLVWISVSGNGIFVYNKRTKQVRHITKDDADPLIDSNYIIAMMTDGCGNVWVSQEHMGVVCLKVSDGHHRVMHVDGDSYQERNIRMLKKLSNGYICICNNAGDSYIADGMLNKIQPMMKGKNLLTAFVDSRRRLLLGSRKDGIYIDGKWTGKGRIESIAEDYAGRIWACGLHNGLYVTDGSYETFFRIMPDKGQRQIVMDYNTGNMLVAADKGLICFNPRELRENYRKDSIRDVKSYHFILSELCRCVLVRPNGDIWVGTANRGVFVRKAGENDFTQFTHNDGLPNDAISFIMELPTSGTDKKQDRLVVGTENGLAMYDGKHFSRLYTSNKPLNNFCQENACAILANGNIAVGTLDGIVVTEATKPSSVVTNVVKPLAISEIISDGVSVMTGENTLELDHNKDNLTFYFSTYDFTDKGIVDYSYMLEGYDTKWSSATTANVAQYKNLKPGTYRFRVRYRNANGKWVEAKDAYDITILPPWWATWWAYLVYFILICVIAFVIYKQIINTLRLKRKLDFEKRLSEYQNQFFTNVSHEFRTPLTLIQDSMQRISSLHDVPSDLRLPLCNMRRDVERMMRLINQLLEFRKMQDNKLSLALQNTDVVVLLHNIWINFYDTAKNNNIAYTFVPQKKSLTAFVDRSYIDKIVYNLLSNAFKYTPKGGVITLRLNIKKDMMNISVYDSGIGIPKDEQPKIFERYATGKVSANSLGIGLHLTQELVKVHHGEIRFRENSPRGSVFSVLLPLNTDLYSASDYMKDVPEFETNAIIEKQGFEETFRELDIEPMNDKTVLVVDDTPELCDMIKKDLGRFFHVIIAADGFEAMEILRHGGDEETDVDLVVSDIRMPRMDGFELTKSIRSNEKLKTLPVILLTSLTDDAKILRGLDVGADAYITKPFSVSVLVSQCAMLIRQRSMLRSAYSEQKNFVPTGMEAMRAIIKKEKDKKFINSLDRLVRKRIADKSLDVDSLAASFSMGRTVFYNTVKNLTGMTPNKYICDIRLKVAATLLREENLSIAEVAERTGFSNPQYLSRSFKIKYGMTPTEYAGK